MSKDDGGPAFPETRMEYDREVMERQPVLYSGMTLRDYFAAAAMNTLLMDKFDPPAIAARAFCIADAMLAERAK